MFTFKIKNEIFDCIKIKIFKKFQTDNAIKLII